ncbi:MAG: hypothetical protein H6Q68_2289 [Firmicutes bacterium]|nr:hypothetical protein [Bacillota bacterium]
MKEFDVDLCFALVEKVMVNGHQDWIEGLVRTAQQNKKQSQLGGFSSNYLGLKPFKFLLFSYMYPLML